MIKMEAKPGHFRVHFANWHENHAFSSKTMMAWSLCLAPSNSLVQTYEKRFNVENLIWSDCFSVVQNALKYSVQAVRNSSYSNELRFI